MKDQGTEVTVPGEEDPGQGMSLLEERFVGGSVQAGVGNPQGIMAEGGEEAGGQLEDILVEEEPHAGTRWMSSFATRAVAYWTQARMSSAVRVG